MPATSALQLKRVLPLLILLVGLAVLSSPRGTGQAASATRQHAMKSVLSSSVSSFTCGTWSVVDSPNVGSSSNELSGVAAVSASNSWAVGDYLPSGSTSLTLIEHWNGTSWSVVASPNHVGSIGNVLSGVARVPGSSNIWAVGFYTDALSGLPQTLIEFFC